MGVKMTCEKVRQNLWGYHHRQVSDDLASSIRNHLEGCADCVIELERFEEVDVALDGFSAIEPSPYFDQKLNARLDEAERASGWGWVGVWLRDPYLWTFVTVFMAATGLWLGFRHQQNEELRSMEEVVRLQDEYLGQRSPDEGVTALPPRGQTPSEVAVVPEQPQKPPDDEETISEEDLAVVENLDLLQDYDVLKDLAADSTNGGDVKAN
jgi:hypothetical protein